MRQRVLLVLLVVLSSVLTAGGAAAESRVDLVSRGIPSGDSDTGNGASRIPAPSRRVWSADGRWLVFTSTARDLVPGQLDRQNTEDVFLYDRSTGSRSLVSRRAGSTLTTANASSFDPVISPDGRWIAFVSNATDLVAGQVDPSGPCSFEAARDIFLHDRLTGATALVSHVAGSLLTTSGCASAPALSADGAVVAFEKNGSVYLSHLPSGEVTLVSHKAGSPAEESHGRRPSVSADGRFVAFVSQARDLVAGQVDPWFEEDTFLYDRDTGTTLLVSHAAGDPLSAGNGNGNVFFLVYAAAVLSADGRWVAFMNRSSNLVPGQNEASTESMDVFLWDRTTDTTILVSRSNGSPTEPMIGFLVDLSPDGGWVLFAHGVSDSGDPAGHAPELHLFSRDSGTTVLVNHAAGAPGTAGNGSISDATLSADGRFVAFRSLATDLVAGAVDTNDALDVFLFDRLDGGITLVSHASGSATTAAGSASETPRISPDGGYVAFGNPGTDLVAGADDLNDEQDVVIYDRSTGSTQLASLRDPDMLQETPHGASAAEGLSADGRFVVFTTEAVDVVPGVSDPNGDGTDVYLWDRDTGERSLVSRSASAATTTANGESGKPAISADGRWVVFQSTASDLVAGQVDTNGVDDVFLWDRLTGDLRLVSGSGGSATQAAFGVSERPAISADGRWIAFLSSAEDLIAGQATTTAGLGAFLWDRNTGTILLASRKQGSAVQGASSYEVALSADGSFVGFVSDDPGVVPGQVDTANTLDVFELSRATGETALVSHASSSPTTAGNSSSGEVVLSADGSRVAFTSHSTDLIAGQDEGNSGPDVFLWTRGTGTNLLVSRRAGTVTATPDRLSEKISLSADGRFVAFESAATNLVAGQVDRNGWDVFSGTQDIFLFDAATASMTLVSRQHGVPNATGDATSRDASISADGLAVAFRSTAGDLLPVALSSTYSNVYVFERLSGRIRLASRTPESPLAPGDFDSTPGAPRVVAGGSWVAFTSSSSNLVPGDFNDALDAFLFSDPPVGVGTDLFVVAPCRLFDTRRPEDGPALVSNVPVLLEIDGGCGIPATARALALNVTVWEPAGSGHLDLYPGDSAIPATSTINFTAGLARANNAIVTLALDGTGTLGLHAFVTGGGTVHVILDVVGYFE